VPSFDRLSTGPAAGNTANILSSDWTGLSRHLLAVFYPVRKAGEGPDARWERVPDSMEVQAPITDGQIEQTQNWNSPFEQTGVDAKLSSFSAMLQTGSFAAILNAVGQKFEKDSVGAQMIGQLNGEVAKLAGLSGVTKLNSTQVFTGSPPLKLTFSAHFRALFDATAEVQAPINMLTSWSLPKKLASDGVASNVLRDGVGVRTVYASQAPQIIGMVYANQLFKPMVIESVSRPLTAPLDRDGRYISASLQMTIASLTALDRDDWTAITGGR
jgi:hypothetical protein